MDHKCQYFGYSDPTLFCTAVTPKMKLIIAKLSPSPSQPGYAGSIFSFSVLQPACPSIRLSRIVLSGQNWTFLSKAK